MSRHLAEEVTSRQPSEAQPIIRTLLVEIVVMEAEMQELRRQFNGKTLKHEDAAGFVAAA